MQKSMFLESFWHLAFEFLCCLSMQHRNERRGLGGIFFDDLNDYDQEMLLNFATGEAFC
jgi:coproporphyrinogen III oxidase